MPKSFFFSHTSSTPCPRKTGTTDFFHNNFYKYAQIFMIFGTQLCKWILIILVNLLRCVPCTSLTWWHNVPSLKSCRSPCTWHCHNAAERDARFYLSRDVATQFARFESGGLQHLGYPSREGLPFADPRREGVEWMNVCWGRRGCWTTPSSWQWLRSGIVVWMHVFA